MSGRGVPGEPAADWSPGPEDVAILRRLADGATLQATARSVGLSERTVRRRLRTLAAQAGVETTIATVVHAVRSGDI